jgi:hypothetical protein
VKVSATAASSPCGAATGSATTRLLLSPFAADATADPDVEASRLRTLNTLLKRRLDDVQRTASKCADSRTARQCRRWASAGKRTSHAVRFA